ncbi:MAG TPA: glycosyltransferase family 4 protein [Bryobacteraceae bacterium]|nr:glycosyltransferase family 4 protein [Bryobacteraceae bacterium]
MRLAYLLSQYPAVNHVFMLREVRYLRRAELDVHVASIRGPDRAASAMTAAEREEAARTYYVKSTGWARIAAAHLRTALTRPAAYVRGLRCALGLGGRGVFYFGEAVAVGDWMRRARLRHVHTHFASTVGLIVARVFPVTLSITFHGPAEFLEPAARLAEKVRAALFTCTISQFGREQLMAVCDHAEWPKLEVTPLGVDPAEFAPRPFRSDPSPFRLISVGRLAPEKGQHVLIEAVAALVKDGRKIELRLIGGGPDRAALERDAAARGLASRVVFEGNVNQDRLRALYRDADALALSSFAEGLPVVLMEAMAMEIPCVASTVNGVPEIITHDSDGLLAPPGDAEALAAAIARLMDDAELRRAFGERARRKIIARFDLEKNAEYLASVFRRRLGPL